MTRVAVSFEWQPLGEVILIDGKPRFPSLPRSPGAYRLRFQVPDAAARVYIGETDGLHRLSAELPDAGSDAADESVGEPGVGRRIDSRRSSFPSDRHRCHDLARRRAVAPTASRARPGAQS